MKHLPRIACVILLAGFAGTGLAGSDPRNPTVPEILQVQHALRAKLDAPGSDYARMDRNAVAGVKAAQDRIFALLEGVTSLDQLNVQQRTELANALDQVKATLLATEDKRVICRIERKTGTNLTSRRCESVADREKNVRESRKFMLDHPDRIPQRGN